MHKKRRPERQRVSIRGRILRESIRIFSKTSFGKGWRTGEIYKKIREPFWIPCFGYQHKKIRILNITVEEISKYPKMHLKFHSGNSQKVILFLHGGGYIGRIRNIYRRFAVELCRKSEGAKVYMPDYRTAPEDVFPAALKDAVRVYLWLLKEEKICPEHIIVAGDSAGGGLSLAMGHYLKRHRIPMPSKFLLLSPWTDLALTGESLKYNHKRDPLFGETKDSMIYQHIYPGTCKVRSPYISPLYGTFDGFPPILIQAGEFEMLLSDSLRLAKKAEKSGVKVQKTIYPGMFHVFQMAFAWVPESRMAWKEIGQFLKKRD